MNWKEINKKYPNSAKKCYSWAVEKLGYEFYLNNEYRQLFDFFDEQEIYGCVARFYEFGFIPEIFDKNGELIYDGKKAKNRPDTEKALFEKEFEILEQQLTK